MTGIILGDKTSYFFFFKRDFPGFVLLFKTTIMILPSPNSLIKNINEVACHRETAERKAVEMSAEPQRAVCTASSTIGVC